MTQFRHPSIVMHYNPFSHRAEGARYLDGFRALTVSYPMPFSDMLSTDATGSAQMLVLPNLSCSSLVLQGSVSSTSGLYQFAGYTSGGTNPYTGVNPVTVAGVAADVGTNLRTVGSSYRLVGWGVVIKTLPGVSSTGRVILTKFTSRGPAPGTSTDLQPFLAGTGDAIQISDSTGGGNPSSGSVIASETMQTNIGTALATRQTIASWLRMQGLPPATGATPTTMAVEALRRIPGTVTASVASLGVNGLLVRGKRTGTQCQAWRGTGPWATSVGSTVTGGTLTRATNTANVWTTLPVKSDLYEWAQGVDATYLDMTGHDGLALVVSGAAANTAIVDFEVIYHVEVTPKTDALLTNLRPPMDDAVAPPAVMAAEESAHSKTPHFQLVPHHFRELANGVLAGAMGLVGPGAIRAASQAAGSVVGRAMTYGLEGAVAALAM